MTQKDIEWKDCGNLKPFFEDLLEFKDWLKGMDDPIARIAWDRLNEFFKTTDET